MARIGFYRVNSEFARRTIDSIRECLQRGETVYVLGFAASGTHNTGVALIEITQTDGPRTVVNNEEERFSGKKHTTEYPRRSIDAMVEHLRAIGRDVGDIAAIVTTWDYPVLFATLARTVLEEVPGSLKLLTRQQSPAIDRRRMDQMRRTPRLLAKQFGLTENVPMICMPHHDNHAWFSFAASPFADSPEPVAIAVLDGTGDQGSVSLYVAKDGAMRQLYCNDSVFNFLGACYSVISSTQGGWTWLSSEGRYMGAAAWGDMNRTTNPYYARLRHVLHFGANGRNQAQSHNGQLVLRPLREALPPRADRDPRRAAQAQTIWNPDAVLRVEDIHHRPDTRDRLDKAAATQLVFEDALIHIVDHLLRATGAGRLVLTGGVALNALANMRLLEHFDQAWFAAAAANTRLHLWVPPVPGDPGVPIGAAWLLAQMAGAPRGAPMTHAFYCGTPPLAADIAAALDADDVVSQPHRRRHDARGSRFADLMAYMVAQNGVIALYQGAAETGPRALGHRSILANPCNPDARELINERVKYREPSARWRRWRRWKRQSNISSCGRRVRCRIQRLQLHGADGASKPERAKFRRDPCRRHRPKPDRASEADPLTYAYLKALGRRIGVEISVNTSFNVAGPIAQTPRQAIDTLRRSRGLDAAVLVADDGAVTAAWHGGERDSGRS